MLAEIKTLMRRVVRLRVVTDRLADEYLAGAYHSVFKGQGVEVEEVREYVPGDDMRAIDWSVTARTGKPHVKRFREERELAIMLLVDVSGSQAFGSTGRSKADLAAELTALLALSAIKNQDRVGLIMFSDRPEKIVPPRRGTRAVMRLIREVLAAPTTDRPTDIAAALHFLNRVRKRRAVVFLISDFIAQDFEQELRIAAGRHDVICCVTSDPAEVELPNAGLLLLHESEGGTPHLADTSSRRVRRAFRERANARATALNRLFGRMQLDAVFLSTARSPVNDLRRLFERRYARMHRGGQRKR